jgi:hypothetical protein
MFNSLTTGKATDVWRCQENYSMRECDGRQPSKGLLPQLYRYGTVPSTTRQALCEVLYSIL